MKINQQAELKVKNLNILKNYLNVYFYETLSLLKIRSRLFNNKLNEMWYIRSFFLEIEHKYHQKSFFYYNNRNSEKNNFSCLYVYISEKLKLSGVSSEQHELNLLKKLQKNDKLIVIGQAAIEFSEKYDLSPLLTFPKNQIEILGELKTLIYEYYLTGKVNEVKFVFVSDRLIDGDVTILPINKFVIRNDWNNNLNETVDITKYHIYPNLNQFQDNLAAMYVESVIYGMIFEASFYLLKKRLLKIRNNINEVDKKISAWNYQIVKNRYEEINNDIIITHQDDNNF
ncbi:hypothetical protein MCAV_01900 [[Mycoplasma] cavipharyngis]|uniref:MSC_0622 family F1-like ATPase gamma subunit n=1 Tax=[Mycoplasma] cavipharyngis TaxID=92757 RepID=UPI0037039234